MSFTRLRYHLVTATKYRYPFITPDLEPVVYNALAQKAHAVGAHIFCVNGISDHIHIIAAIPPTVTVATFMRELKTSSARAVNATHTGGHRFEWQAGYGAFTVNCWDFNLVLDYVAHQKTHHAANTTWPIFERSE